MIESFVYQRKNYRVLDLVKHDADLYVLDVRKLRTDLKKITRGKAKAVALLSLTTIHAEDKDFKRNARYLIEPVKGEIGLWKVNIAAPQWRKLVRARMKEIFAAGFDGICYEGLDTFGADPKVLDFFYGLTADARLMNNNALAVPLNGEWMTQEKLARDIADAWIKEDLVSGAIVDYETTKLDAMNLARARLTNVQLQGKPVLTVEFLPLKSSEDLSQAYAAVRRLKHWGYVPCVTTRGLNMSPAIISEILADVGKKPSTEIYI